MDKINKNPNLLRFFDRKNIYKFLENTNADCITLIGVLEHLVDIQTFLKCIEKNKNIKIIYLCVPMFSVSCLIENSFSHFKQYSRINNYDKSAKKISNIIID